MLQQISIAIAMKIRKLWIIYSYTAISPIIHPAPTFEYKLQQELNKVDWYIGNPD